MRSGNTTPPCAIEDWSGAGFHTKQPLNVGQPVVSQVVSSPNNQSCLDPLPWIPVAAECGRCVSVRASCDHCHHPTERELRGAWHTPSPKAAPLSLLSVWSKGAVGRNGKQASASKILLSWARGLLWRWRHLQGSPSRRRASESPVEFSFPPDADSCGL